MHTLPLLAEPEDLEPLLGEPDLLIVDLCQASNYAEAHIPDAVHLEYANLLLGSKPAPGLLPDEARLSATLSAIGLTSDKKVVAYDVEGGGRACRFIWTLDALGHPASSLLNGGLFAWANEGHPLSQQPAETTPSNYSASIGNQVVVTQDYIEQHLGDAQVALLDARSPEEYAGTNIRAARGGHIPGAVNLNWLDTIDRTRNYRLLPDAELRAMIAERGLRDDQEIITYCHTHHRSAHSYVMLRHLGFDNVKGYPGAWAEWSNSPTTPVEK
jgi:thiosulfate/3-mercaptopyruvate sulfurtransferase